MSKNILQANKNQIKPLTLNNPNIQSKSNSRINPKIKDNNIKNNTNQLNNKTKTKNNNKRKFSSTDNKS